MKIISFCELHSYPKSANDRKIHIGLNGQEYHFSLFGLIIQFKGENFRQISIRIFSRLLESFCM